MIALLTVEFVKLRRQPALLLWGFLAAPAVTITLKIAFNTYFLFRDRNFLTDRHEDILLSAANALGLSGNPFVQFLLAIGISGIFFVDYRHATFRNLVPRAHRISIVGSKFIACLLCASIGLGIAALGDVALNLALSAFREGNQYARWTAGNIPVFAAAFVISLIEISTLTAIVATATILFRSMMAAVAIALFLGLASLLLQAYFGVGVANAPLPLIAADAARAWLFERPGGEDGLAALGILAAWCGVSAAIGAATFLRQELASE